MKNNKKQTKKTKIAPKLLLLVLSSCALVPSGQDKSQTEQFNSSQANTGLRK